MSFDYIFTYDLNICDTYIEMDKKPIPVYQFT